MPLHGSKLYGSDFNAKASDAEFRAAMSLWWQAWNQVPAASLPNDEVVLAKLADLGRDVRAFRKVRKHALYGFIECSDGRLYHETLAAWALEAWQRRVKERARKANWRAGKHSTGDGDNGVCPGPQQRDNNGTDRGTNTGPIAGHRRDVPAEAKVSEGKRSERESKTASVVVQTSEVRPAKVNGAVSNNDSTSKANGQDWNDPHYVAATAQTLGIQRHPQEDQPAFRDRVYEAVQAKIRAATSVIRRQGIRP